MKFHLMSWPGLQSHEGWTEAGGSVSNQHTPMTDKLRLVIGKRSQILATCILPYPFLSILLAAGVPQSE